MDNTSLKNRSSSEAVVAARHQGPSTGLCSCRTDSRLPNLATPDCFQGYSRCQFLAESIVFRRVFPVKSSRHSLLIDNLHHRINHTSTTRTSYVNSAYRIPDIEYCYLVVFRDVFHLPPFFRPGSVRVSIDSAQTHRTPEVPEWVTSVKKARYRVSFNLEKTNGLIVAIAIAEETAQGFHQVKM